jgi:hypothetical protein
MVPMGRGVSARRGGAPGAVPVGENAGEEAVQQCTPDKGRMLSFLTPKRGMFMSTAKAMAAQK